MVSESEPKGGKGDLLLLAHIAVIVLAVVIAVRVLS